MGHTPLAVAALKNDRADVLNYLISAGSNPSQTIDKVPLLGLVAKQGLVKKTHFQALYAALPKGEKSSTLERALQTGDTDLLFDALNKGAKIELRDLLIATKAKQKNIISFITDWFDLELGSDTLSQRSRLACPR